LTRTFHIYYPIWVKFRGDLHLVLMSICAFRENRRRKAPTNLMVINKITFMRVPCYRKEIWMQRAPR